MFAVSLYGILFMFLFLFGNKNIAIDVSERNKKIGKYLRVFTIAFVAVITVFVAIAIFTSKPKANKHDIEYDYIAVFNDIGTINEHSNVFFRGVEVGKVVDTAVTTDSQKAEVFFNISEEGLKLYHGVTASKGSRGFVSSDHLVLNPPAKIEGMPLLKKGAKIKGLEADPYADITNILTDYVNDGKFKALLDNSNQSIENLNKLSDSLYKTNEENRAGLNRLIKSSADLTHSLKTVSDGFSRIVNDNENVSNIRSTLANSKETVKNTNTAIIKAESLIEKSENLLDNANKTIGNENFQENITTSTASMSMILSDLEEITGDDDIKQSLKNTLKDSDKTIKSLNCFTTELGHSLSKRFLIPRMLLGKPGESLNNCSPENLK